MRFEQHRAGLDPAQSLRRALAPEGDTVIFQGRSVHVASWAKRFLFRPEQLEMPVGRLSGGEQARILIARLMCEPADLLILDEPTNDLDIPTLEVLEDSLAEFDGALVLVTHDRFMLDRVSTVILALDGEGGAETYADYAQWEAGRARRAPSQRAQAGAAQPRRPVAPRPRTKRLGYLEQREWEGMERADPGRGERGRGVPAGRGRSGDRRRPGGAPGALRRSRGRARRGQPGSTRAGRSSKPSRSDAALQTAQPVERDGAGGRHVERVHLGRHRECGPAGRPPRARPR